mgnify:CR=1 FL=1
MKQIKLNIKTKTQKYPIIIGSNLTSNISNIIRKNSINFRKCLIVVDKNIPKKFIFNIKKSLKQKKVYIYFFKANEINKNINYVNKILEILLKKNFSRDDCVISVGGGITGDVSGFVASLFKRGLKFINLPTTLLSQVDSSIGGKTGVNSPQGKNLIGTFYQPDFVVTDVSTLEKLPNREMVCGYGEILKHSFILDKSFFNWLDNNGRKIIIKKDKNIIKKAIVHSCKIKSKIVEKDEKEKNLRKVLNFGHTFAHGFEAAQNFSKKLNHGEAVLLGMAIASKFSYEKKILSYIELTKIINHYRYLNLPLSLGKIFKKKEINKIIYFMQKDKKNLNEKINLILIKKIGKINKPIGNAYSSNDIKNFLYSQI